MIIWNTLAFSSKGTHKLRFKEKMSKSEAEILGKEYCLENVFEYIGTYDNETILSEELNYRKVKYGI